MKFCGTVTAVDSGIRALQFLGLDEEKSSSVGFDDLKVDLIITDYCMPGMTGYELLKKIKRNSGSDNVIGERHGSNRPFNRCLEEGAEDFIVKPVKLSDVKRLRDYMTAREFRVKNQQIGNNNNIKNNNKRRLRETCDLSSSPLSMLFSSSSPSPSLSPSSLSSPSSPSPCLSPLPSPPILSYSAPCSPTSLDSPTRRLKMSSSD
ncbi:hypothetical protein P3X46_003031 [Hevea brasiliensis]|uniref:Response regulatory domain-containing protein n=1 Tax=Hevea brasiliensis TaxID=3981 RepID=A0ABQ9N799_HEVBR|nr:hypothetical protein P3X46_003031 [Hevea brasiliensis]